jgi:Fe-S cluster assembly iron-binding protein IscA
VYESRGVKVVFEKEYAEYLEEAVVSYSDSSFNPGFKISGARM